MLDTVGETLEQFWITNGHFLPRRPQRPLINDHATSLQMAIFPRRNGDRAAFDDVGVHNQIERKTFTAAGQFIDKDILRPHAGMKQLRLMPSHNQRARRLARGTFGTVQLCGVANRPIHTFRAGSIPPNRQRFSPHIARFLIEDCAISGDSISRFGQRWLKQKLSVPAGNLIVRTIQNVASA